MNISKTEFWNRFLLPHRVHSNCQITSSQWALSASKALFQNSISFKSSRFRSFRANFNLAIPYVCIVLYKCHAKGNGLIFYRFVWYVFSSRSGLRILMWAKLLYIQIFNFWVSNKVDNSFPRSLSYMVNGSWMNPWFGFVTSNGLPMKTYLRHN